MPAPVRANPNDPGAGLRSRCRGGVSRAGVSPMRGGGPVPVRSQETFTHRQARSDGHSGGPMVSGVPSSSAIRLDGLLAAWAHHLNSAAWNGVWPPGNAAATSGLIASVGISHADSWLRDSTWQWDPETSQTSLVSSWSG